MNLGHCTESSRGHRKHIGYCWSSNGSIPWDYNHLLFLLESAVSSASFDYISLALSYLSCFCALSLCLWVETAICGTMFSHSCNLRVLNKIAAQMNTSNSVLQNILLANSYVIAVYFSWSLESLHLWKNYYVVLNEAFFPVHLI